MREIKFRAWDKTENRMARNVEELKFNSKGIYAVVLNHLGFEMRRRANDVELMQYTGLKDRNGKEIFEGDIVAFEDSDGGYEYPDVVVNTGIVEYGELGFYFTNRVAAEMDDFYIKDGRCDDVEVIGNIHDNPELMEVE
ncbi:YopX family protein [Proteiniclasticum sp.]|uniref:YopX family protein n=1 Tax=Proteiniclasticum sp. TaxID=2053595 RepID=UPI002897A9AD|nr:YopX family protein [Proteiniclasticum sp.]